MAEEALVIERGEGTDLIASDGRRYIDGVSSLWCNVHGHRHPGIDKAIRDQIDRISHSTMLGLTHPLAAELAERLIRIAPPEVALHTREFAAWAVSEDARTAAADGAYGLAATVLDVLHDPALAAAVAEEFEAAGGAIDVPGFFD